MIPKILVIPDAHAKPGVDNLRFQILGELIIDVQPDWIICIGDFADMPSLSRWDVGKRQAEGQRYDADVESVQDANEKLWTPLRDFNRRHFRKGGKPKYDPKKIMLLGNHEHRIKRYTDNNAALYGFISFDDLEFAHWGWEVIPFLTHYKIENIKFSHYFTQGLMDKPIGGINPGRTMTQLMGSSAIQGHTHELKIYREGRGEERWGIVAGCWFDHIEEYVSPDAQNSWWRGVTILNNVDGAKFTPEFITLETAIKKYSK